MTTPPIPKSALDFIRRKKLKVSFNARDVWPEEHRTIFTVAKVVELDVLADIKESVDKAIADGESFGTWKRNIRPMLAAKGWLNAREVIDNSTGEIGETHIGAPPRLRLIYETNTRSAYNAAQWERIQRTKDVLPYLLRTVGPSVHHRLDHLAWHGTLLPADDPWILSHPCPTGYGCKCRFRQVGRVEFAKLVKGGVPSPGRQDFDGKTGLPTGRLIRTQVPAKTVPVKDVLVPMRNKRTGKVEYVPRGVDPSFVFTPGIAGRRDQLRTLLKDKIAAADPKIKSAFDPV